MTLTVQKSNVQMYIYGVMTCSDKPAVHSTNPLRCLQRQVAELGRGLFYSWSLLRNNSMATNLQRCNPCYCSRRFVACDNSERRHL